MPLKHPTYNIDINQLEIAYQQSIRTGHQPRALLVTNPANPTGRCYSQQELTEMLVWCRSKKLFYISSEVYGTCCYRNNSDDKKPNFVSIIDVAFNELKKQQEREQLQEQQVRIESDNCNEAYSDAASNKKPTDLSIDLSKVLGDDIQIIWSGNIKVIYIYSDSNNCFDSL